MKSTIFCTFSHTYFTHQSVNKNRYIHLILNTLIAAVWLINGFVCKVLNLVPRHQEIVARILGETHARSLTLAIGGLEICMALWILTGYKSRFNAILQIVVVAAMNLLEFVIAPDLLLWGKFNSLFALLFILVVYFNAFVLNRTTK